LIGGKTGGDQARSHAEKRKKTAPYGIRTRANRMETDYANHYTNGAPGTAKFGPPQHGIAVPGSGFRTLSRPLRAPQRPQTAIKVPATGYCDQSYAAGAAAGLGERARVRGVARHPRRTPVCGRSRLRFGLRGRRCLRLDPTARALHLLAGALGPTHVAGRHVHLQPRSRGGAAHGTRCATSGEDEVAKTIGAGREARTGQHSAQQSRHAVDCTAGRARASAATASHGAHRPPFVQAGPARASAAACRSAATQSRRARILTCRRQACTSLGTLAGLRPVMAAFGGLKVPWEPAATWRDKAARPGAAAQRSTAPTPAPTNLGAAAARGPRSRQVFGLDALAAAACTSR
jgi:hypothetical protein